MGSTFDDPRWRQSEELAYRAEHVAVTPAREEAAGLYVHASRLAEEFAVSLLRGPLMNTRGIAVVSAVALAARGGCYALAVAMAARFLAERELLAAHDVRALVRMRTLYTYATALPQPLTIPHPTLDEHVRALGFESRKEFEALVMGTSVGVTESEAFTTWRRVDGTRDGLLRLRDPH